MQRISTLERRMFMPNIEYIDRFIENDFAKWKKDIAGSKALMVKGCRQVGKTTTVKHFAERNYKYVIYIDVRSESNLLLLETASEYNVANQLAKYCEMHKELHPFIDTRDTVLILDEVQESKAIYERIRTFSRNLQCDVIFTGSNLKIAQEYFQPAGDNIELTMYPLSFEEYINYFGGFKFYKSHSISEICAEKYQWFKDLYDVYIKVGGYPDVFKAYLHGDSIENSFESLLNSFKSELRIRTVDAGDFDKIDTMFRTICELLCREKKGNSRIIELTSKLTEQVSSKRISTKECNNILAWLQSANIVAFCDKRDLVTDEIYSSERFYFEDVGMFTYMCNKYQIDKTAMIGIAAENFVFKQLAENNFVERFYQDRPMFAVKRNFELDFIVTSKLDQKTYGIEVKVGENAGTSLMQVTKDGDVDFAVLVQGGAKDGKTGKIYTLPIFLFNKFVFDKGGLTQADAPKRISFFDQD